MIERPWKVALPAPPPPPISIPPVFVTPQENDSASISSLCLASTDSPLMSPIFAKMSVAIGTLLIRVQYTQRRRETDMSGERHAASSSGGTRGVEGGQTRETCLIRRWDGQWFAGDRRRRCWPLTISRPTQREQPEMTSLETALKR